MAAQDAIGPWANQTFFRAPGFPYVLSRTDRGAFVHKQNYRQFEKGMETTIGRRFDDNLHDRQIDLTGHKPFLHLSLRTFLKAETELRISPSHPAKHLWQIIP